METVRKFSIFLPTESSFYLQLVRNGFLPGITYFEYLRHIQVLNALWSIKSGEMLIMMI